MIDENDNNNENGQQGVDLPEIENESNPSSQTIPSSNDMGDMSNDGLAKNIDEIKKSLDAIYDVPVKISAVLGQTTIPVNQLLRLGRGAVVELERKVGEPIDILVNNRLVARGEVVVVENRLGITMTEIIKTDQFER